ncbi:MAG: DUF1501 domain-containing protein [Planctomycetales bacterium]|nr:DUF1501 domain-containing protein [Planctomycetales bacterium]
MLNILGSNHRYRCSRFSRRDFLTVGTLGLTGLSLPDILRAESANAVGKSRQRSVIMVFLPGGPPHQDMFDLKPLAPREIRGEFHPINTNVPGIQICEHLPRMAGMMDKLVLIRTVVGALDRHESFQCMTGHLRDRQPPGGYPEFGSIIAKLKGPTNPSVPAYVGLSPRMQHRPYNSGDPGCLGPAYAPFQPHGGGRDDLVLKDMTLERLKDRQQLLQSIDGLRRDIDVAGVLDGLDSYQQQAFGILTSSQLAEALDTAAEPQSVRDRYGYGTEKIQGDAAPRLNQQFLIARRLVEAGARIVTLSYSFWDWHGQNFRNGKANLPDLDQAVSALVEDLHQRGLDDHVTLIVWGEFGRTPRINKDAGRDHWPRVSCALMAGAGLRTGQAIGQTDRSGGEPVDRPVHFQELHATLYHVLGIDPHANTYRDLSGRPNYLVEGNYQPIAELI